MLTVTECAALLGVETDATADEVKDAYRTKVRDCHPDLGNREDVDLFELRVARDKLLGYVTRRAHMTAVIVRGAIQYR